MFYQVDPNSSLYTELLAVQTRMNEARVKADAFAEELGATQYRHNSYDNAAGGLVSLAFEKGKVPKHWVSAGGGFYRPGVKVAPEVVARMTNLPLVTLAEVNALIGFKADVYQDRFIRTASFHYRGPHILISLSDLVDDFQPVAGLVEMLASEYRTILAAYPEYEETEAEVA
jgi:hypothetical protein